MNNLIQQMQKMQGSVKQAQEELTQLEVEGKAGAAGIEVSVTITGEREVTKVNISDDAFKEGLEVVQDLVKGAINNGLKEIAAAGREKMGGIGLPNNIDMLKNMFNK